MKKLLLIFAILGTIASLDITSVFASEATLADFEKGIPCSNCKDTIGLKVGFREKDIQRATIINEGAEGSNKSISVLLTYPDPRDIFLQSHVRRMYLATGSSAYDPNGPNALSFWVKIPEKSGLFKGRDRIQFDVLTYHWRPGDMTVGGRDNNSLATDSMMHGYSYLFIDKKARGKWINIVLSPSAFSLSRDYLHFYAAQAATDELGFFPSLRQLQLHVCVEMEKNETIQYDQIKLFYKQPTAIFKKSYYAATKKCNSRLVKVPISIFNPTEKDRKYRVFISSHIGVNRKILQKAFALADNVEALSAIMRDSESDGGVGAADLLDSNGISVIKNQQEIYIPAKSTWKGELVHYIQPEMLGKVQTINIKDKSFSYRRNTLLTSVVVWDPYDASQNETRYVTLMRPQSYADDENHGAPPGFPEQKRPPAGWQSQDIPFDQVGGYFVSSIKLSD